jgi:hypothetical protein
LAKFGSFARAAPTARQVTISDGIGYFMEPR